ncbi:MAG: hypothetical protein ACJAZ2_000969 [Glaciecola sp.]|jgi:hypothetical protein
MFDIYGKDTSLEYFQDESERIYFFGGGCIFPFAPMVVQSVPNFKVNDYLIDFFVKKRWIVKENY